MNNFLSSVQQFMSQVLLNNLQNNLLDAPWKNEAIQAIQNGDQKTGEQLARNIIQSYGFSSPEDAIRVGLQNLSNRK